MFRAGFIRTAALALVLYGLLGLFVGLAMFVVGYLAVAEVDRLRAALDQERDSLVRSLRTVSTTVGDAAGATDNFVLSLQVAHGSATTASGIAQETARSFRELALGMQLQIFGLQPLGGLAPGFERNAQELEQLGQSLADTGAALSQNASDVRRVGADLEQIRAQVSELASTLAQAEVLVPQRQLLPFQVAFFGMCALFSLQSVFSLILGIALFREQEMLRRLAETVTLHRHRAA